ncbi:GcrA family cell cycle regulator [Amaricoccus sp.]|uniref:GcrA family cell cycle regulator n=1 Tax=Amaricoccus sp. TaxID=1872485 RepID=UPI001B5F4D66|nr:GcrA family cell cycle regulator [Amaricoccus sp.]MBP7241360.1 GcrA cell cycle regulator [Amaricoccus sp.]
MSWTDERVETLKAMWAEGKSASQIAKELGGVTRNAVIGKVHRLGLSNRGPNGERLDEPDAGGHGETAAAAAPEAEAPVDATPVEAIQARPREALATPPRVKPPVAANGQPMPPAGSEISPEALANLAEVAKKARRLTLMQLTERTCKWPIGDPATDDFWFCGLPCVAGKPYCETHVAVAFQPMSTRRDRRAGGR